jgi:hypothetical protein
VMVTSKAKVGKPAKTRVSLRERPAHRVMTKPRKAGANRTRLN